MSIWIGYWLQDFIFNNVTVHYHNASFTSRLACRYEINLWWRDWGCWPVWTSCQAIFFWLDNPVRLFPLQGRYLNLMKLANSVWSSYSIDYSLTLCCTPHAERFVCMFAFVCVCISTVDYNIQLITSACTLQIYTYYMNEYCWDKASIFKA